MPRRSSTRWWLEQQREQEQIEEDQQRQEPQLEPQEVHRPNELDGFGQKAEQTPN